MALMGMDVEEVKAFAKIAQAKADELTALSNSLKSRLDSVDWTGPDATKFRSDWDSIHMKNLKTISASLAAVAKSANANATQQEHASR